MGGGVQCYLASPGRAVLAELSEALPDAMLLCFDRRRCRAPAIDLWRRMEVWDLGGGGREKGTGMPTGIMSLPESNWLAGSHFLNRMELRLIPVLTLRPHPFLTPLPSSQPPSPNENVPAPPLEPHPVSLRVLLQEIAVLRHV